MLWTSHRAETILDGFCGPQKPLPFKLLFLPLAWLGKIQQLYCCRFEIAVSGENLKKLKRWYAPFQSRFVLVYHSRLHDALPPAGFARKEHSILTVGHLATAKGQTVLVDAFARIAKSHPDATLLVAGHDSGDGTSQQIQKAIHAHGLEKQVCLLGQRDDTPALMREAEIYVQPSLSEALGLALQEAMFYGCAVIGTRTGGIPELVDEGKTGALVAPGNIEELSAALDRLLRDSRLAEQWGANAANSIRQRRMTVESMTDRYLELYERATTKT
jgi:glycosyltransferase involved in cell wall biosynthesis